MRAVDDLTVDDGVGADVFGKIGSPSTVPAIAVTRFDLHKGDHSREAVSGGGTDYNVFMSMCGGPPARDPVATNTSGRTVFCVKFQKDLPGLDTPPWPGEMGQRLFGQVSVQAWKLWEERQKMILNEYRLMPWQKEGQELILKHMEDFFFGEGSALPPDFVPVQSK